MTIAPASTSSVDVGKPLLGGLLTAAALVAARALAGDDGA